MQTSLPKMARSTPAVVRFLSGSPVGWVPEPPPAPHQPRGTDVFKGTGPHDAGPTPASLPPRREEGPWMLVRGPAKVGSRYRAAEASVPSRRAPALVLADGYPGKARCLPLATLCRSRGDPVRRGGCVHSVSLRMGPMVLLKVVGKLLRRAMTSFLTRSGWALACGRLFFAPATHASP